jgi:hypothetical protein
MTRAPPRPRTARHLGAEGRRACCWVPMAARPSCTVPVTSGGPEPSVFMTVKANRVCEPRLSTEGRHPCSCVSFSSPSACHSSQWGSGSLWHLACSPSLGCLSSSSVWAASAQPWTPDEGPQGLEVNGRTARPRPDGQPWFPDWARQGCLAAAPSSVVSIQRKKERTMQSNATNVVVIGGGCAGVMAANRLT